MQLWTILRQRRVLHDYVITPQSFMSADGSNRTSCALRRRVYNPNAGHRRRQRTNETGCGASWATPLTPMLIRRHVILYCGESPCEEPVSSADDSNRTSSVKDGGFTIRVPAIGVISMYYFSDCAPTLSRYDEQDG